MCRAGFGTLLLSGLILALCIQHWAGECCSCPGEPGEAVCREPAFAPVLCRAQPAPSDSQSAEARGSAPRGCPHGPGGVCTLVFGHLPLPQRYLAAAAACCQYRGANGYACCPVTLDMRLENVCSSPLWAFSASLLSSACSVPLPPSLVITRLILFSPSVAEFSVGSR